MKKQIYVIMAQSKVGDDESRPLEVFNVHRNTTKDGLICDVILPRTERCAFTHFTKREALDMMCHLRGQHPDSNFSVTSFVYHSWD